VSPMLVWLTTVAAVLLFAAPLPVEAQAGRVWRIGFLTTTEADNPGLVAFRQRLRELGYVEGQNVALEIRSTKGRAERFPSLADELVRLKVDVIVAGSNASIEPAQKATTTIPIVMVVVGDPVASGFVASLARPGGNITGLTTQAPDLAGKRLQLLKEAISNLSRVAILWEPGSPGARRSLAEFEAAATALGLQLNAVEVRSPDELDGAVATATRSRAGAAIMGGPIAYPQRTQIAQLAVKRHLPILGPSSDYAEAGWLIGYGPSYADLSRRSADFVDRILKGAKPADLPVEQPTKVYLSINLKTAKALGLSIPQTLRERADQVIEK